MENSYNNIADFMIQLKEVIQPLILFVDLEDINSKDLNPLKDLKKIRLIVITSKPEDAANAFENNACDFLLKPIWYPRFLKSLEKAFFPFENICNLPKNSSFFINSGVRGTMVQLFFSEILYVEGLKNYIQIHTTTQKHITYLTLSEIEAVLAEADFIRIQKSFIVNAAKIKFVERNSVDLVSGTKLPLGGGYQNNLFKYLTNRAIRSCRSKTQN